MNHPHHHHTHTDAAPQVLLDEANIPRETIPVDGAEPKAARGMLTCIQHVDDFPYHTFPPVPQESIDAQLAEVDGPADSEGSVCDSQPDTRSLYERYPGTYPFPVYHRTGKKHPNGKDVIATTIPPQPLNWVSDRKKFDVEAIRILAGELGYNFENSRLAHFIKMMIPRMVQS